LPRDAGSARLADGGGFSLAFLKKSSVASGVSDVSMASSGMAAMSVSRFFEIDMEQGPFCSGRPAGADDPQAPRALGVDDADYHSSAEESVTAFPDFVMAARVFPAQHRPVEDCTCFLEGDALLALVSAVLFGVPLKRADVGCVVLFRLPCQIAGLAGGVLGSGHARVKVEQFFEAFGVVLEAAADIDAFQYLVVALVRVTKVGRHFTWFIEFSDGCRKVRLPCEQNVLGAARQVHFVLLCQIGNGKAVPTERVRVSKVSFKATTDCCNPRQMNLRR